MGGLPAGGLYRWKARFRTNNPVLPVTPWFTVDGGPVKERTLRTRVAVQIGKDPEGPVSRE